jgi:DNA repair ATPase RecN
MPLKSFLAENGLESCEDHQLLLKRAFTSTGANRQFINGSPTTLSVLCSLGAWLVDIHGPHDHQSLLHQARQLAILDAFGNLESQRDHFAEWLRRLAALNAEKTALIVDEKTYAQQLDLLRFQTNEITSASLRPDEEEQLNQEHQRASNAAKLLQLSRTALAVLNEEENSLTAQTGILGRSLQELHRVDARAKSLVVLHAQLLGNLRELGIDLARYAERIEIEPERLQQFEERLNLIHSLKRKYGSTLSEVIAFGEAASRKLQSLEQRDVLALKTVLATEDDVPVLIFDEVDANVGGETAAIVGEKMQQIAREHQVICITHLAPVAAPASAHYVVNKQVKAGRTISEITLLEHPARVRELARMLGSQTDAARKHAEVLLKVPR